MNLSNLTLCYQGIQRIYRNSVVQYLRTRLHHAFPDDHLDRLAKPFLKEWPKIRESAQERRQTGELSSDLRDDYDLLGVNHFFNLFDAYYDQVCPSDGGTLDSQKKANKNALIQWMKMIKSLRDPLSHPSDEDLCFEDAFLLLDCARRVLLRLDLGTAAEEVRELEERLYGRPMAISTSAEPLEDRLPPRESIVVDFVGRKTEMNALWEWFNSPGSRRWALAGEGGKGKSAIALSFANEVKFAAPKPYQLVLWLSAKKKTFQEGKIVSLDRPDFEDLDGALSRLLQHFGWVEESSLPTESKKERVIELLNNFPSLVIIDDIDSLESVAEDAIEFFTLEVPRTKSKLLLTSRRVVFGMGSSTTHVTGFTEPDAEKFVLSRCRLMGLDPVLFGKDMMRDVVRVTEASPLYMEDLLRLMTVLPPSRAIRLWEEKGSTAARQYALGRELDLLSRKAREVLTAACVTRGHTSFPELMAVANLSEEDVTGALQELQRLFLVPRPRIIEGEQRFEVNLNTRALVRQAYGSTDMFRRAEAAHRALSGQVPRIGRKEVGPIISQAVLLVRGRDWVKAEALLKNALEKYLNDPDLLGILGWIYKAWDTPRVTDAREYFRRAWQLKCANEGMYKHWSRMEINEKEWTRAAEAAEKGLKFNPHSRELLFQAGYARGRLARELASGLHQERAAEELRKSDSHLERALALPDAVEPGEKRLNSDTYRAKILNCEMAGDQQRLAEYFGGWLREHPEDPNAQSEWTRLSVKFGLNLE